MKTLFDTVCNQCSKITTQKYSTSFSLGIRFLNKDLHQPIYAIYGFVRFADEIVDSFHEYDKKYLLDKFRKDTFEAIEQKISLNPILNAFQAVVNQFKIDHQLIHTFLDSMQMDLERLDFNSEKYKQYILGSAEVVGLMCLQIFVGGNDQEFEQLKPFAMRLGAGFQKVNFLRDLKADYEILGRIYFPGVSMNDFSEKDKKKIEQEIAEDFKIALEGIRQLPKSSRAGVYLAYRYYMKLFTNIKLVPAEQLIQQRIRVKNVKKISIMINSYFKKQLNVI